jgi:hypothetical protein
MNYFLKTALIIAAILSVSTLAKAESSLERYRSLGQVDAIEHSEDSNISHGSLVQTEKGFHEMTVLFKRLITQAESPYMQDGFVRETSGISAEIHINELLYFRLVPDRIRVLVEKVSLYWKDPASTVATLRINDGLLFQLPESQEAAIIKRWVLSMSPAQPVKVKF